MLHLRYGGEDTIVGVIVRRGQCLRVPFLADGGGLTEVGLRSIYD